MSEQQPRQSYDDIEQNGPNSEQFDAMVRHSEMLNDPAREARMAEMGRWAELSGAMTEQQQNLFEHAGKAGLAEALTIEEVRERQATESGRNALKTFLAPDSSIGSARTSGKNVARAEGSSVAEFKPNDPRIARGTTYRSPNNIPS